MTVELAPPHCVRQQYGSTGVNLVFSPAHSAAPMALESTQADTYFSPKITAPALVQPHWSQCLLRPKYNDNGLYYDKQPSHTIATGGRVNTADARVGPEMPPPESAGQGIANNSSQNTAAPESTWSIEPDTLRPQAVESTWPTPELAQL